MQSEKKGKKDQGASDIEVAASVTEEMVQPRKARSVRIAELNLENRHTPERPSTTMPGIVDKIISSPRPSQPEKAQIAVGGADQGFRDLRIENTFTDEHSDDVRLKKMTGVEVTFTTEPKR